MQKFSILYLHIFTSFGNEVTVNNPGLDCQLQTAGHKNRIIENHVIVLKQHF